MVPLQIRVIYGDTDQAGIVYYANYLRYFEAGRTEFLRAKRLRYRDVEASFRLRLPVVEAEVRYRAPALYEDLLTVETSLTEAGRASLGFGYRVHREGTLVATGQTRHACVDLDGAVQRLPAELLAAISQGEEPGP